MPWQYLGKFLSLIEPTEPTEPADRVFNNSKLKCAHKLTKRRTKMRTSKFFQKAHIFWSKCAQVPTYFGQNAHKNAHIKNFQKNAIIFRIFHVIKMGYFGFF